MSLAAISGRWATLVLRDQHLVTKVDGRYALTERGLRLRPLLDELYRTGEALLT